MEYNTDLLETWIEEFKNSDTDVETELKEVQGAIANERIWQKGETEQELVDMREQNITDLTAYKEWLEEQL